MWWSRSVYCKRSVIFHQLRKQVQVFKHSSLLDLPLYCHTTCRHQSTCTWYILVSQHDLLNQYEDFHFSVDIYCNRGQVMSTSLQVTEIEHREHVSFWQHENHIYINRYQEEIPIFYVSLFWQFIKYLALNTICRLGQYLHSGKITVRNASHLGMYPVEWGSLLHTNQSWLSPSVITSSSQAMNLRQASRVAWAFCHSNHVPLPV